MPRIPNISKIEPLGLLAAGSILQFTLTQLYPSPLSILPILTSLLIYWSWRVLEQTRPPPLTEKPQVRHGRWTAQLPDPDGSAPKDGAHTGVVVFVLGVTSTHPQGLQSPGFPELGASFHGMWAQADIPGRVPGYLGHTTPLIGNRPTTSNILITLSYWRDIDSLHAFAHSDIHRKGWDWWNRNGQRLSHLGLMHEVYAAPAGGWESIYINFPPFALGASKVFRGDGVKMGEVLVEAEGRGRESMMGRMGRAGGA